jgi:hypothetical protein
MEIMEIDEAKIEELKTRYTRGIYEGEISFTDDEDKFHKVEFIYRKPTTADMESYTKSSVKNPVTANLNFVQSLIIYPEPGPVIAELREYVSAVGKFIDEAISPFFGANAQAKSRKL